MKGLGRILALALVLFSVLLGYAPAVQASDLDQAKSLFTANCAQCHRGGLNIVVRDKSLKKEALEKYGMNSREAIIAQATQGKNAMPAFGRRLSQEQIASLADYVLAQAEAGWSS